MKLTPEQEHGIRTLQFNPAFGLFDDPGYGKSVQVIKAAEALFREDKVQAMLVVTPAQCIFNWDDMELGELAKWSTEPMSCTRISANPGFWRNYPTLLSSRLEWFVVTWEYFRENVETVATVMSEKARWGLVLDESHFTASRQSLQYAGAFAVRYGKWRWPLKSKKKWKDRWPRPVLCWLLTGSPRDEEVTQLWSQFNLMDYKILGMTFWEFRARFAILGGFMGKEVKGEVNTDELTRLTTPYVLCRKKTSEWAKAEQVVEIPLTATTWKAYTDARDTFLEENEELEQINPGVRAIRMAQACGSGDEKLKWIKTWRMKNPGPVIIWCWFREEIERVSKAIGGMVLYGGISNKAKDEILRAYHPSSDGTPPPLVAQPSAGGLGLNLAKSSVNIYYSCDYSLTKRNQSQERIDRRGQTQDITTIDLIAVSPKGKKTSDMVAYKARRRKETMNEWTKERWRKELLDGDSKTLNYG